MKKSKQFLFLITKERRLELIIYILLEIVLLCFFSLKDIIDITTFSSVVIASAISFLVSRICRLLYKKAEDASKLTADYTALIKQYNKEEMFRHTNTSDQGTAEDSLFPIIKVADLFGINLNITDNPEEVYQLPNLVSRHYIELLDAHKSSKIYNNPSIRVNHWAWDEQENTFRLFTGRTTYFNSMVTNRAMDYKIQESISVRDVYECGPYLSPLAQSSLSNHLGFNALVESSDGYIAFILRSSNVSIGKHTFGSSIGASIKVKYALDENRRFTREKLWESVLREMTDELMIDASGISSQNDVMALAAYRDLVEGGKPQLLFYITTKLSRNEISARFYAPNKGKKKQGDALVAKYSQCKSAKEERMLTDGKRLVWFEAKELLRPETKIYPDKIIYKGKRYPMVPSTAASVAMFVDWKRQE
ncbi:MAG: hypothetical protein IJO72_07430 [Oscillospiraceae bacterium]|nr:hypothetical protein [Oscillospiraceae bacterium]MBQ9930587.1 hypothetical protein [Oscillospiraceae bacterium]